METTPISDDENESDYLPLVINIEFFLADLIAMTAEKAEKIIGQDDDGNPISHLPPEASQTNFFFNLGTPATFDLALPPHVSVGNALQKLARTIKDEYLAKPQQYDSGGKTLHDICITQLVWWPDPDDNFWQVVTNAEREV